MDNGVVRRSNRSENHGISAFFQNTFLSEKLNNWIGYIIVTLIAIVYGFLTAREAILGMGLFGLVLAFFVVLMCVASTETGLYVNVFYSFSAYHFSRLLFDDKFPVGVAADILIMSTLFSLFVKRAHAKKNFNDFIKAPIVICFLIVVFYLFIQLFNPYGHSVEGWFQIFRRLLTSVFILFVSFIVFDSYKKIMGYIKVLFICCFVTALYGCFQQWHGLFNFEQNWVMGDRTRYALMFVHGNFRKFSLLADPSALGIVMSATAAFFIIISVSEKRPLYKYIIYGGVILMILSMAYSGTRTANAMLVGGLTMYILLTFNKKSTKIFAFFSIMAFLFLLYVPIYNNATLFRFRTSFSGTKDESYKVRQVNRNRIQPYIYSHPIGGGLYTTGFMGMQYNPGHELAGFPPDSGYLRKALETGWIGLTLTCILYFIVLRSGIRGYFEAGNQKIKTLYAACIVLIFCFYIGEFTQEAIGQIADMVVYYPVIAIILRLRYFQKQKVAELS